MLRDVVSAGRLAMKHKLFAMKKRNETTLFEV